MPLQAKGKLPQVKVEHAETVAPAAAEASAAGSQQAAKQSCCDPPRPVVSGAHAAAGSKRKRAVGDAAAAHASERMPPPAPRPRKKRKPSYGTWQKLPEPPADLDQARARKARSATDHERVARTSAALPSAVVTYGAVLRLPELPATGPNAAAELPSALADRPVAETSAAVRDGGAEGTISRSTWLTLPEAPAMVESAALRMRTAMEDGAILDPVAEPVAATRGGPAADSASGSTWLKLPETAAAAQRAAVKPPGVMQDRSASQPVTDTRAATGGVAATIDAYRGTWQDLPEMPAVEPDAALEVPSAPGEGAAASISAATRSDSATCEVPRSASPKASETPAKAPPVGLKPPSAVTEGRSEDVGAAARGGAAMAGSAPHNTRLPCPETLARATGAAGRIAPCEVENRLLLGGCTVAPGEAVTNAPQGDGRLCQPAGNPEPVHAHMALQSSSAPSQTVAAGMMPLRQKSPLQLQHSAISGNREGQHAAEQLNTIRTTVSAALSPAVPQQRRMCRYCREHGVEAAFSPSHRASCQYYNLCLCFQCRQLHLKNELQAESYLRRRARKAAAACTAALEPPSAARQGRSADASTAAACDGVAVMGSALHSTRLRFPETLAGATGGPSQFAPSDFDNRVIAGVDTMVGDEAVPSALLGDQRLNQLAGNPEPTETALQTASACAPSQTAAAATMPLRQNLPLQLGASTSPSGGGGHNSEQQLDKTRASIGGVLPAAVPRPTSMCRFCAVHGVERFYSPTHRASCVFFNQCGCFKCRQLHIKNDIQAEINLRSRKAAAAAKAAARQLRAAGKS